MSLAVIWRLLFDYNMLLIYAQVMEDFSMAGPSRLAALLHRRGDRTINVAWVTLSLLSETHFAT
jgi:hypothetical protein